MLKIFSSRLLPLLILVAAIALGGSSARAQDAEPLGCAFSGAPASMMNLSKVVIVARLGSKFYRPSDHSIVNPAALQNASYYVVDPAHRGQSSPAWDRIFVPGLWTRCWQKHTGASMTFGELRREFAASLGTSYLCKDQCRLATDWFPSDKPIVVAISAPEDDCGLRRRRDGCETGGHAIAGFVDFIAYLGNGVLGWIGLDDEDNTVTLDVYVDPAPGAAYSALPDVDHLIGGDHKIQLQRGQVASLRVHRTGSIGCSIGDAKGEQAFEVDRSKATGSYLGALNCRFIPSDMASVLTFP